MSYKQQNVLVKLGFLGNDEMRVDLHWCNWLIVAELAEVNLASLVTNKVIICGTLIVTRYRKLLYGWAAWHVSLGMISIEC